ncbi:AarF/ABC1/UbiB kinase family protein [Jeotgalibacillus sp. S-D1]|uniref:ABC1 kinase family protein n=1 Tax=Jeotgalibacillus sp. S-D1 TaxID=2552189 RepID=UPI0014050EB1|nr:lipopolysaccharide core heptose(II) kinase RfaY [Jeotgalibacillus sp. S-D1]
MEKKWDDLAAKQAREYKKTALKLEGLMIKLGQFLSTRADIMPKSFLAELEGLTDRVPAVPWEKARRVIEEEWNTDYSTILQRVSAEPAASASIGDVYKGWLHNGDAVAIKVQRPGIESIIRTDFKAMRIVIWLAKQFTSIGKQMDLVSLYHEMTKVIGDELNFKKELANGVSFSERFSQTDGVEVPFYHSDYTTHRVLVMEWIEGAKITDQPFLERHNINPKKLASRILNLFIQQLLNEGMFHADPHSGNILLKSDGTIVLIDFGMVGMISQKDADAVQQAVEGIIFEDYEQVVKALESMKFLLPHADKELLAEIIERLVVFYKSNEWKNGDSLLMEQLLNDMQDIVRKQPIQLPTEFAFFGRAISIFTGVIYSIYTEADLIEMARPTVLNWVKSRNEDESFSDSAFEYIRRYFQPLLSYPIKIQEVLDEPRRYRRMQQENDRKALALQDLVTKRRDTAFLTAIPLLTLHAGVWFAEWWIAAGAAFLVLLGGLRYRGLSNKILNERNHI